MSIMVGTGRGAQAGVLIRNAEALERLEKIDTLVVDKTGTLTEGKRSWFRSFRWNRSRSGNCSNLRQAWNAAASIRSPRPF